ncbi:MAG: hypothetical protein CMJ32_07070 [Phycisphaerae bacterium]|nr:hypothetical protein [Phycisphaerae bacterium]
MTGRLLETHGLNIASAGNDPAGNDPRMIVLVMILLVTIFLGFFMTLLAVSVLRRLVRRRRAARSVPIEFKQGAWEEAGRRVQAGTQWGSRE